MKYIRTPVAQDVHFENDVYEQDTVLMATFRGRAPIAEQKAAEAVAALNMHDDLVDVCRMLVSAVEYHVEHGDYVPVRIQIAADRAIGALAKLEADHAA